MPTHVIISLFHLQGKSKGSGGNACLSRPVPEWQKPISMFFKSSTKPTDKENSEPNMNEDAVERLEIVENEIE